MVKPLCLLLALISISAAQRPLDSYNVDSNAISVSGTSSGACFATQFHLAHSSTIMGCGTVAGVVYYCAEASAVRALQCMSDNNVDPNFLVSEALRFQSEGKIDDTINIREGKVFVLQGSADTTVLPANAQHIKDFYVRFMSASDIGEETSLNLVHGFPTEDYGTDCNVVNSDEYINRCQYHGAFEMLQFFYGGLQFYLFDQNEFYPGFINLISMDSAGYVYIPSGCLSKETPCKLHVSFHGCHQGRGYIGDAYAMNTFYNQVGELNDIIILSPQVIDSTVNPANPEGCWDWWGYNDSGIGSTGNYATRGGAQIETVKKMIDRLQGNI